MGRPVPLQRAAQATEAELNQLLQAGDPVLPGKGLCPEDANTVKDLRTAAGPLAGFGLTPDGHLVSHEPIQFQPVLAVEQVIRLWEADFAAEDKEETLAATWLGLAYHDHDHPADFGGLLTDASPSGRGEAKCCYVDVKGTSAAARVRRGPSSNSVRGSTKFGCLALTVTAAANNGFAGYPGFGRPGLLVTLLHNPVRPGKKHAGYAVNWFFGISANYQAAQATWGWGGEHGVKLPLVLEQQLAATEATMHGQKKSLLTLLKEYRDYGQFKDENGAWDREMLQATLEAKALAARYILMNEDPVQHAESTVANLTPPGVGTPLRPEDFQPGDSFAAYYGRKCDAALRSCVRQRNTHGRWRNRNARRKNTHGRQKNTHGRQKNAHGRQKNAHARPMNAHARPMNAPKRSSCGCMNSEQQQRKRSRRRKN